MTKHFWQFHKLPEVEVLKYSKTKRFASPHDLAIWQGSGKTKHAPTGCRDLRTMFSGPHPSPARKGKLVGRKGKERAGVPQDKGVLVEDDVSSDKGVGEG